MNLTTSWPELAELCARATAFPDLEVWLFGSTLRNGNPRDLDVLIIYQDRESVRALRTSCQWTDPGPELDLIAMTPNEEAFYAFIAVTGAQRIA